MEIHIVTGGSGFVGKYLVQKLLEAGKDVRVLMRPLGGISAHERAANIFRNHFNAFSDTFRIIEGDVTQENLGISPMHLEEFSKRKVVFWHLAANLSFASEDGDDVMRTNYTGTVNTVNVANNIADVYMYVSTAYVCGDAAATFHEEDLDVGQTFRNRYESSKFEAEKYIRNNCSIPYIVFRPSIIMGDAYEGKAEGCTFGYYRFAYMFFIFKKWLVKKLQSGSFARKLLTFMGTRYDEQRDTLTVPWLVLPYTSGGTVDMVSVDYVVASLIKSAHEVPRKNCTIHITNPVPPSFQWALASLLDDLGYQNVKYVKVPTVMLTIFLRTLHYAFPSLRAKTQSALWYLPYITRRYSFSQKNSRSIGLSEPMPITRDFLRKINTYAQREIFRNIAME